MSWQTPGWPNLADIGNYAAAVTSSASSEPTVRSVYSRGFQPRMPTRAAQLPGCTRAQAQSAAVSPVQAGCTRPPAPALPAGSRPGMELEAVLAGHPQVADAAVVPR